MSCGCRSCGFSAIAWNGNYGSNFSSNYYKMSPEILFFYFLHSCLWGFLVGIDRELSLTLGHFPWSLLQIWTKNGSVLSRFLWHVAIWRSKMPMFYSIKSRNSNLKKDEITYLNGVWNTIFWQILMIFMLLDFNYTAWFDHPGLLNLGHFWPLFFVEWPIFNKSNESSYSLGFFRKSVSLTAVVY